MGMPAKCPCCNAAAPLLVLPSALPRIMVLLFGRSPSAALVETGAEASFHSLRASAVVNNKLFKAQGQEALSATLLSSPCLGKLSAVRGVNGAVTQIDFIAPEVWCSPTAASPATMNVPFHFVRGLLQRTGLGDDVLSFTGDLELYRGSGTRATPPGCPASLGGVLRRNSHHRLCQYLCGATAEAHFACDGINGAKLPPWYAPRTL